MKGFVPDFGYDTHNELECTPTLGDDTSKVYEDDTFEMNEKTQELMNFVKANMSIDIPKKELNTGRSASGFITKNSPDRQGTLNRVQAFVLNPV